MRERLRRLVTPLAALALALGAGVLSAAPAPATAGPAGSAAPSASGSPAASSSSRPSPLALAWRGEPLRVRAARLAVDLTAHTASLEGQVELHRRDAVVRCPRLSLTFDAQGQILSAIASGGVTLQAGELHASAAEARFDGGPQLVRLSGSVQAQQGGLRLTASSATLDLVRQQLDLTDIEGVAGP